MMKNARRKRRLRVLPAVAATAAMFSSTVLVAIAASPADAAAVGHLTAARHLSAVRTFDDARTVERRALPAGMRARAATTVAKRRPAWAWRGATIRYWETIPSRWQWGLDHAIGTWNNANIGIRFVKAKSRATAQLKIDYGYTRGADGLASVGYRRYGKAFVHLSPEYKLATPPVTRSIGGIGTQVWVGRLLAHELGHVLGLPHMRDTTTTHCALMVPSTDLSGCPVLAGSSAGMYGCQWVDRWAMRAVTSAYGGRGRTAPALCSIDPLPPKLTNVRITGGGDTPVRIAWDNPGTLPAGTHIGVFMSAACRTPGWDEGGSTVAAGATSWTSDGHNAPGTVCYDLRTWNKTGASVSSGHAMRAAYVARPDQPKISNIHVGDDYGMPVWAFTAAYADDLELYGYWNEADPTTCPAPGLPDGSDGLADLWWGIGDTDWWVYGPGNPGDVCVTFVVENQWGVQSNPLHVQFAG